MHASVYLSIYGHVCMHASIYLSIYIYICLDTYEVRLTVSAVCPRGVEGTDHQHTKGCRFLMAVHACMLVSIYLSIYFLGLTRQEIRLTVGTAVCPRWMEGTDGNQYT